MAKLFDRILARPVPMAETLGMTIEQVGDGAARVSMVAEPRHHNPMGTVHGGVYVDLADMAMGLCFSSVLDEDEAMTTIELKINYIRPMVVGLMVAKARVITRGRTTGIVDCDVENAEGKLVARASSTLYVLTGERGKAIIELL